MKTYYKNNDELARDWVSGTITEHAYTDKKRMIAYGPSCDRHPVAGSIYSYGQHFCIARKWKAPDTGKLWYLVTLRSFSPTTRRHIEAVRGAIPSDGLVYLPQVDDLTVQGISEINRLVKDYGANLLLDSVSEADLGALVFYHEIKWLDEYVASYLRSRVPYPFEFVLERCHKAAVSIQRFGLTLPARFEAAKDQCHAHSHARAARNAVLASTLPARRRLLSA